MNAVEAGSWIGERDRRGVGRGVEGGVGVVGVGTTGGERERKSKRGSPMQAMAWSEPADESNSAGDTSPGRVGDWESRGCLNL